MKKLPTIDIKGSAYTLVKDRVLFFNETFPNGSIVLELVSPYDSTLVVMQATVTPDVEKPARKFVDYSQAIVGEGFINKSAAMENCSTSATGRALALLGIGVVDSIASADEMNKATTNTMKFATEKQIKWLRDTAYELNEQLLDDEAADKFIESILTIKPEQVPVYKVKDAVDKLKTAVAEQDEIDQAQLLKDVTTEDGSIPY